MMIRINFLDLFLTAFVSLCVCQVAVAADNFDIEEFHEKNQISKYAEVNFTDTDEVALVIVMHSSIATMPVSMMMVFETDVCIAELYHESGVGSAKYHCKSGSNMRATYQCQRESCLLKGIHQKRGNWSFHFKYNNEKVPSSEVLAFSSVRERLPKNGNNSGELHAKAEQCKSSAIECLNIGGFGISISSTQPTASDTVHLFARGKKLFSCPTGYSHFDQANMVADPYYISVCGEATETTIQNNMVSKDRLHIFKSRACPEDADLILSTSQIVLCTNTTMTENLISPSSMLDRAKSTCTELGFTLGTEKHGDCVLKMMDN